MSKSYPKAGASVKQQTPASSSADRSASRSTATFVPYYWEAYNEIVEPRRFDHYLIRKWQRDLGPVGFAIVKNLRDRCYHNPAQGVLRDTCEVDLQELGEAIGVSRSTVIRELRNNAPLQNFLQRVRQFRLVEGRPQKDSNRYRVCMDDPIHPDDMERYDQARAAREIERQPLPHTIIKGKADAENRASSYKGQNEPYSETGVPYKGQIDPSNTSVQFDPTTTSVQFDPTIDYLPSGSLTKESLTAPPEIPPINLPPGEACHGSAVREEADPLQSSWNAALVLLAALVNAPTLNAHLKPMRLVSASDDTAVLLAPSSFSRTWIESRHRAEVEAALGEALGRPVLVRITTGGKIDPAGTGSGLCQWEPLLGAITAFFSDLPDAVGQQAGQFSLLVFDLGRGKPAAYRAFCAG